MYGNNVNIMVEDDVAEIEKLLAELENWSNEIFSNDWQFIENSGCISPHFYEREKNLASARNYERLLIIQKLRARLLCE